MQCSQNMMLELITYQRWLLTSSTFSLDKFFIFSSILWIHCNISSFFLLILLFFSTKGFSWLSVSRERFSCKWQRNKVSCALVYLWRKQKIDVFSLAFLNSESLALLLNGIWHTPLLNKNTAVLTRCNIFVLSAKTLNLVTGFCSWQTVIMTHSDFFIN